MRWLFLLLVLVPGVAVAEARLALTRESEPAFMELMHQVQQGAMGQDVVDLNATILKDRVQIDLKQRDGGVRTLWVWPAPANSGSFFRLEIASGATADDVDHIQTLLRKIFSANPFLVEHDGMDAMRVNPMAGAPESAPGSVLSPRQMAVATMVNLVALLVAMLLLWRAALRRQPRV